MLPSLPNSSWWWRRLVFISAIISAGSTLLYCFFMAVSYCAISRRDSFMRRINCACGDNCCWLINVVTSVSANNFMGIADE